MHGYDSCDTNYEGVSPNYIVVALPRPFSVDSLLWAMRPLRKSISAKRSPAPGSQIRLAEGLGMRVPRGWEK
jgi:hypothetical protein